MNLTARFMPISTTTRSSSLQRDPQFQDANLQTLNGRTCPRPDRAFLQRLIDYGIATRYARVRYQHRLPVYFNLE